MPAAPANPKTSLQGIILKLQNFWAERGCVILQPYDMNVGAGTSHPATTLRALGPDRVWNTAFVQPSRRPKDARYGDNPNRLSQHHQFQVILKPSPSDVLDTYLQSLQAIGIDPDLHDIRFVEDDWENPTLGAWGLGWEVWCDGMEITQFTYFQQVGGYDCSPIPAEITYGLERLVMYIQNVENVYDLDFDGVDKAKGGKTYGDIYLKNEQQQSAYIFDHSNVEELLHRFSACEAECKNLLKAGLPLPAYDQMLMCGHTFNLLDARGVISVVERASYIGRVRDIARECCKQWVEGNKV